MVKKCDEDIVLCEKCESPEFLVYWAGNAVLVVCQECNQEKVLV